MSLVWGRRARRDFIELISYIAEESIQTAGLVAERIDKTVQLLMRMPRAGRKGRVTGTRELVVQRTPYISYIESDRAQYAYCASTAVHAAGPPDSNERVSPLAVQY